MPTVNRIIKSILINGTFSTRPKTACFSWRTVALGLSIIFTLHFQYFAFCSVSYLSFCFKVCSLYPVPGEAAHSRFYSALCRLVTSQHIANFYYAIFPCFLDVEIKSSWATFYVTSLYLPTYLCQHVA